MGCLSQKKDNSGFLLLTCVDLGQNGVGLAVGTSRQKISCYGRISLRKSIQTVHMSTYMGDLCTDLCRDNSSLSHF